MMRHPIHLLSYGALGLLLVYMALVGATLFFASAQTHLTSAVHNLEGSLSSLEKDYYVAIEAIHEKDPSVLGLQKPTAVVYVSAGRPVLSRAEN